MTTKANIAVFVSGGGTNLQALLDAQAAGRLPDGRIALVVADKPGIGAILRAEKAGVPCEIIVRREPDFEQKVLEVLREHDIDEIVLAGFLGILSKDFLEAFSGPVINVHPALIPSFCGKGFYGLRVHEAALSYGVKVTGATVHYVNEIPDGGEIIAQRAVAVAEGDTPETLQRRVMEQAEWIILPEAAEMVAKKIAEEKEQEGA